MAVPIPHLGNAAIASGNQSEWGSHRQASARQKLSACHQNNRNGNRGYSFVACLSHDANDYASPSITGRVPGRPVKTREPPHGLGKEAHIKPTLRGSRPDLAHQISNRWATARPGPSIFPVMGRGPARPINFSDDGP